MFPQKFTKSVITGAISSAGKKTNSISQKMTTINSTPSSQPLYVSKRGYLEGFNAEYFHDGNVPNHHHGALKNQPQFAQMLKPSRQVSTTANHPNSQAQQQPQLGRNNNNTAPSQQSEYSSNIDPCYRIDLYQDVPIPLKQPIQQQQHNNTTHNVMSSSATRGVVPNSKASTTSNTYNTTANNNVRHQQSQQHQHSQQQSNNNNNLFTPTKTTRAPPQQQEVFQPQQSASSLSQQPINTESYQYYSIIPRPTAIGVDCKGYYAEDVAHSYRLLSFIGLTQVGHYNNHNAKNNNDL